MANSVVHFEIFAADVERARKFYEQVFGWSFEVGGPPDFYFIATGPDTDRGLTHGLMAKRRQPMGQGELNSFRVTIRVSSISDSMAAIKAAGGTIRGSMTDIPHVGKVAEFTDTEGNIACVMEYAPGNPLASG